MPFARETCGSCGAVIDGALCPACGRFAHEARTPAPPPPRPPRRFSPLPLTAALVLLAFGVLRAGPNAPLAWDQMPRFESRPGGDPVELAGLPKNRWGRVLLRIKADHMRVVWADGTNEKLDDQLVHCALTVRRGADGRYRVSATGDVDGDGLLADVVALGLARVGTDSPLPTAMARALDRVLGTTIRHGEANGIEIDDRTERLTLGGRGRGWAGFRVVSLGRSLARIDLLGGGRFEIDPKRLPLAVRLLTARLGTITTLECKADAQLRLGITARRAGLPAWLVGEIEFRAEGRKGRRAFRVSGVLLVRTRDWVRSRRGRRL